MKKVLIGVISLTIFTLSSCSKNYTCQCNDGTGDIKSFTESKKSKGDADDWCREKQVGTTTCFVSE